ncbi:uncharacterized protein ARMOST_14168 [Armillaria ostoyae]|uniref:Uncharacterized protein n=1 Tax=Armillaria ostoyae TaxID=47428 RepID=A0A284RPU9_ARMOS|nr:uncharacterized protein ARMOST_14168 [Armillaria ostoyae]
MDVSDIPNSALLEPPQSHPSHILSQNMLLYSEHRSPLVGNVSVCTDCLKSMQCNVMPKLSLANNMWLGHVLPQLAILNLPERILVARYFPAGYIVKLYPKIKSAQRWDSDLFASGIKGNVSTYPLPHAHISSFIDGRQTMPPAAGILSALIGVTFIQPNKKVQYPFPKMLHVRHRIVFDVLQWLQSNNPLWSSIHTEMDRIASLPEDGVPDEIVCTARITEDMDVLSAEQTGYVPEPADDDDTVFDDLYPNVDTNEENDAGPPEGEMYSEDIALQSHGVVDANGNEVIDEDLREHALTNGIDVPPPSSHGEDHYKVKCGSHFINEYEYGCKTDDVCSKVPGTDESWKTLHLKIWSTTVAFNPPNLWLTINPNDTQDPIAQVITGESIDLDDFVKHSGPSPTVRSKTIAADPYASAKFFHLIVAWIDKTGEWGPRCLYGYVNNFNPPILVTVHSNHDIKLITNTFGMSNMTWYITTYVTKKQTKSSNASTLLAKTVAFHKRSVKGIDDFRTVNKCLLQCCSNTLGHLQEFSAQEVWDLHNLAPGNSTFETVLNDFVLVNPFLMDVMENVDYFHKCLENAKKKPPGWIPVNEADLALQQSIPSMEGVDHDDIEWDTPHITEMDIK